jgi:predicted lysophospholipase L1 biosynthesis ABC-type transport system permease subunit
MLIMPMSADRSSRIMVLMLTDDVAATRMALAPAVAAVDPTMPVIKSDTLEGRLREASKGPKAIAATASLLGALSIVLAGAGLHSLMSYSLKRRRREIGIRMAIGADTASIAWSVTLPGVWLVVLGAMTGILVAVPIATVIRSALLGISPLDVAGLLPSVVILLIVATVAGASPVYRATRVDPIASLRQD